MLEHDAEKACPALDAGWVPVFGKTSCSKRSLERDDDSKKRHPALISLRMTAVFDDRRQAKTGMLSSLPARSAAIGGWLADQWPKAAIGFGFALTTAWVVALGWGLTTFVLSLL
jgi:hypothetical protein